MGDRVLNTAALYRSMLEDVALWLTAFDTMVATKNQVRPSPDRGLWTAGTPLAGRDRCPDVPGVQNAGRGQQRRGWQSVGDDR